MKLLSLLTICCCFCITTAFPQGFNFININTDNGLPSNECYRIVQDKKGYIWVATEGGLVRYNSKDFIVFGKERGMPSTNDIYGLDVDNQGRIWFATGGWKVGYIKDDSAYVLPNLNFFNGRIAPMDIIYKLKYDDASQALLISSNYQSISVSWVGRNPVSEPMNPLKDKLNYFIVNNNGFVGNSLNEFIGLNESMSSKKYDSIYPVVNGVKQKMLPINLKNHLFLQAFSSSLNNTSLFISVQYQLFLFDKTRGTVTQSIDLPTPIHNLLVSKRKGLWVGCKKNGLLYFKNSNLYEKPVHILQSLSVSSIIEDSEGGIWVTTLEKGIFYCANPDILLELEQADNNEGVDFIKVLGNKLFLSTGNMPLAIIDKDTLVIKLPEMEDKVIVNGVEESPKGYFISSPSSSFWLDKKKKMPIVIYQELKGSDKKILVAQKGLAGDTLGNCYGFNNVYMFKLHDNGTMSGVINGIKIRDACIINSRSALLGCSTGLYQVDLIKKTYAKVITHTSFSTEKINKIYHDMHGNYWLSRNSDTVVVLDANLKLKTIISLSDKDISCRNILQVSPTSFFVCTNKGLRFVAFSDTSFQKYTLRLFDKSNGLPAIDIYNVVFFRGRFYATTTKGLCSFENPESLHHSSTPNTVINAFLVNDRIQKGWYQNSSLPYYQNNIAFQVDALSFKRIFQRGFFYKYKLEGWDKEFKTATGNTVSYSNLPPGNYTFIAKTYYDDQTEDPTPATFSFTIQPAFWQTWWGASLIILLVIGTVFLFVQWRIKRIKQVEKEKATINQTIAEYRFTALKAQMDPHFVFNSINVIQNLILEKDKTEAYNSLNKFSRLIRMILNQSDSVFATVAEELALITLYIELNQLRVDYPFNFTATIQPQALNCNVPSLIIQPFIENALWHGILPLKGTKEGQIRLDVLLEEGGILVIKVQDNGIGRKASSLHRSSLPHISKGTGLIKERLKAYKAMNGNCLAELNIFDLEDNGTASGTLIVIKLAILKNEH